MSIDSAFLKKFQKNYEIVDSKNISTVNNVYNNINCFFHQQFLDLSEFDNLKKIQEEINVDIKYASLIKQEPGSINSSHFDMFWKMQDIKTDKPKVRVNIFMSDWHLGQLVETSKKTFSRWKIGNASVWDNSIEHFAINFSEHDKITLQFSGLYNG